MEEVSATAAQLMLRRALEVASIGVAIVGLDGRIIEANPALVEILGSTREALLTRPARELVHPDDLARFRDTADGALTGHRSSLEARARRPEGSSVWVSATIALVLADDGRQSHIVVEVEDISAQKAASEQLQAERDLSTALLGAIREGYVYTVANEVKQVNDAICELTGYTRDELMGIRPPYPVWPPDQIEDLVRQGQEVMAAGGGVIEVVWQRKDGTRFDAALSARPVLDGDGTTTGFITLVTDVSERKAAERRLQHRADHDGLTGLLNQVASHRTLRAEIAAASAHGRGLTVALLDLDRFKDVNDTYGHAAGDAVLAEFATRLCQHARTADWLGRIGGEEFLWVMPQTALPAALQAVERVSDSLRGKDFPHGGAVTFSAGIADLCAGEDAESLLSRADSQLYVAKRMGRNRVQAVSESRQPLLFS